MTIQAFFFDIGGVLVRVDPHKAINELARQLQVSEQQIQASMPWELLQAYEKGKLNANQFYEQLLINCGSQAAMDLTTFKALWQDVLFPNPEAIALLQRVSQDFPVWLLSNTNDFHYDLLLRDFPFMQWVTGGIYSFMEGSMKPEAHIYEQAIKQCGFPAGEILFIDDLEANVLAARAVGLQAVQYQNFAHFSHTIRLQYPELEYLL